MEWLSLLLGGGFVATIGAVARGIQMLREQSSKRTERAIEQMEKWRESALDDAAWYQDLADHWRSVAGTYEYELRRAGVTMPTVPQLPQRPGPKIREM